MSTPYKNARSFLDALTDHLRRISVEEKLDINRLRRQIAFERFLERLFHNEDSPWVLKGGYSLEIRLKMARATKDIDLVHREMKLSSQNPKERAIAIQEELAKYVNFDLQDFFQFNIGVSKMDLKGPVEGGFRFPVESRVDGKIFARFFIDVALGETAILPMDMIQPQNWLEFAGFKSKGFLAYSIEQHFADKFHAYTKPRPVRSRVKDLVDMILILDSFSMDRDKLKSSIDLIFKEHATHSIPTDVSEPPSNWNAPFHQMAELSGISLSLEESFDRIRKFILSLNL